MKIDTVYEHFKQWTEDPDRQAITVAEALRFAQHIADRTNDRACMIVRAHCFNETLSKEIAHAIRNES